MTHRLRRWISASVGLAILCGLASIAPEHAGAVNQFLTIQSPFTDNLFGTASTTDILGGVAFAPNGNVWALACGGSARRLFEFNLATTTSVHGSHPHSQVAGSPFATDAGCGLTNHPDGFLYSNTQSGVIQLNATTGVATGLTFGAPGNTQGIAVDPQTSNLVYVGLGGTLLKAAPGGASSTFSSVTTGNSIDGIAFDPTGNFLFLSNRSLKAVTIITRNGALVQNSATISGIPDGVAFHAQSPKFVVTNNNDGTMTRLDFPGDDYTKVPTLTTFASGGFRGDLTQVGPDGCNYVTQRGTKFDYVTQRGTKFDDGSSTGDNSIVRICGNFVPPPGVTPGTIFETTFKRCNTLHVGYNRFKDGTVVYWNVTTNGVGKVASGQFTAIGGGKLGSKTYHFLDIPLGTTLPSEASGIQSHMHFHWGNGGFYAATRDSGC